MASAKETRKIWQYVNKIAAARGAEPNTVYLWAVKQVAPPIELEIPESMADNKTLREFWDLWAEKGIGYTVEITPKEGKSMVSMSRGISSFSEEESERMIKVLESVAWKYKIPLVSPDEAEKYESFL